MEIEALKLQEQLEEVGPHVTSMELCIIQWLHMD